MVSDIKIDDADRNNALLCMARLAYACPRREYLAEQEDPNATRWVLFDGHSDGATFAATCPRCRTEYKSCFPGAWSAAAVGKLRCRLTEPKNKKRSNVQCGFCTALDEVPSMCISCGVTLVQGQICLCNGCTGNTQPSASSQVQQSSAPERAVSRSWMCLFPFAVEPYFKDVKGAHSGMRS